VRVGDLVKITPGGWRQGYTPSTGIVTKILGLGEVHDFVLPTTVVHVLCSGDLRVFEMHELQVITDHQSSGD